MAKEERVPSIDWIEVWDFGPIGTGRLDLRPFTVFVGPGSTGKSCLASLVYALHRYFSNAHRIINRQAGQVLRGCGFADETGRVEISEQLAVSLFGWVRHELGIASKPGAKRPGDLPLGLVPIVRSMLNQLASDALVAEVQRCLGVESGDFIRRGGGDSALVRLGKYVSGDSRTGTALQIRMGQKGHEIELVVPDKAISMSAAVHDPTEPSDYPFFNRAFAHSLNWHDVEKASISHLCVLETAGLRASRHIFRPFTQPTYYLPADREGIMNARRVVASTLIRGAAVAGLRPATPAPLLSGIKADFLENVLDPDKRVEKELRGRELGTIENSIEGEILGGSIVEEETEGLGIPVFKFRPGDRDAFALPLMSASSMVAELAPLVLYLRHHVTESSLLIVEEPESHLHPAMQVQITRQLAALANAGVRVIITTHSEWILEELANIVRASQLPAAEREGVESGAVAMSPEMVGAWLFDKGSNSSGTTISEIALDESGLYPSGFDEVAAALHNDWARIESRTHL